MRGEYRQQETLLKAYRARRLRLVLEVRSLNRKIARLRARIARLAHANVGWRIGSIRKRRRPSPRPPSAS